MIINTECYMILFVTVLQIIVEQNALITDILFCFWNVSII